MNYRRRLFLACLEDRATPAAGVLDPTFDTDGRVSTALGPNDQSVAAVAIQPDGKIVVVGTTGTLSPDFTVVRYNADGSLDTTFDTDGKVVVSFGGSDVATSVALQPDGKIVVAGYTNAFGKNDFAAIRLNPNGTLDATFDADGRVTVAFDFGLTNDDRANAVAIQADGKIVLAGSIQSSLAGDFDFGVVRLKTDGSLDTSFDTDGKRAVFFDLGGTNEDKANAVVIQPDGKIVVGGYAQNGSDFDFALARLKTDGAIDTTFDTDGLQSIDFGNNDKINALALRPDGRIVAAGSWDGGVSDFAVAQFTPAGALDPTFGGAGGGFAAGSGKANVFFGTGIASGQEFATGVAVQPDGKVVVSGYSNVAFPGLSNDFAVARLLANGSGFDPTFGHDGEALVNFGADEKASGLALQPDGKIVVAGTLVSGLGGEFAVARLTGDTVALSVTVVPPAVAVPGSTVTYTVVVANAGPDTATAVPVTIAQLLPAGAAALTGLAFASTAAGGATGNTSGTGPVSDTLTLPAGSSVTYTITGTVPVDARGAVQLQAVAATPAGVSEADVTNNTVTVTTVIFPGSEALLVGGTTDGAARLFLPAAGKFLTPGTSVSFFPAAGKVNVRTAAADVNGDGIADFIGGTGPFAITNVTILDGKTGAAIASFSPFEASFTGGVFVAAADFNGDGKADVIVTPDQGGGPVVVVYDGAKLAAGKGDAAQANRFFGIEDPAFRGGARAAAGDVNADGRADLIVSAGFLGGPRIAVFSGVGIDAGTASPTHLVPDFFAFENTLRNGAFVAVGDVNGDGRADLAFGGGPGGAPRVRLFDGKALVAASPFSTLDAVPAAAQLANFFAGDSDLRGGVRMTLKDVDADGKRDLVTASGEGEPSRVRVFLATNLLTDSTPGTDQEFDPFGQTLANGVFVG